jgi:hypothetical protein
MCGLWASPTTDAKSTAQSISVVLVCRAPACAFDTGLAAGEQEELLAALREPGDVAHHEQPRDGGASTAAHDLGRRFEEMDFDHDGARLWAPR